MIENIFEITLSMSIVIIVVLLFSPINYEGSMKEFKKL